MSGLIPSRTRFDESSHAPVWFFTARNGRLEYLANEFDTAGQVMDPARWLVSVGYGLLRPCSVAYGTKHFPLGDWMLYASRFGLPGIHGETDAAKGSAEWLDFANALQAFANDWVTITSTGAKINLIEAKATGEGPFKELVERSDRLYSKLFRGSDLATSSRGSDAVGASVQQGESDVLSVRDSVWASGILNERIDRLVIRYLFGVEPLAWFRICNKPKPTPVLDLQTGDWLLKSGAPIAVRTARDKFGWPEPEEDEPVLPPAAPPAPFGGLPANVGPASPPAGPSAPPEAPEAPEAPEPDLEPEPPDDPEPLANSRTRAPDPTDPIVRARTAALTQAYRGSMAPFRQAVLLSNSREAALARLKALYTDWPAQRLAEELETTLQIAAAAGAAGESARSKPQSFPDFTVSAFCFPPCPSAPHSPARTTKSPPCPRAPIGTPSSRTSWTPSASWATAPSNAPSCSCAPTPLPPTRPACARAAKRMPTPPIGNIWPPKTTTSATRTWR